MQERSEATRRAIWPCLNVAKYYLSYLLKNSFSSAVSIRLKAEIILRPRGHILDELSIQDEVKYPILTLLCAF